MPDARLPDEDRSGTVRLRGLLRGADLHADATWVVDADALTLRRTRGLPIVVRWEAIDGQHADDDALTLYLAGDDVIEIETPDARLLADAIARQACRVGEALAPLRGLGSHRAFPGAEHERFFAPLLAARRGVEVATTPEAQLAAVDAARLADTMRDTLAAFAAERYPDVPAERRAFEAALLDDAEALLRALARLEKSYRHAREAPADERFARWHVWARRLREVFARADVAWLAALPSLASPVAPRRAGFWRRLLRRQGGASLALAIGPALQAAAGFPA